jgi:hypothetical protein
MMLTTSRQRACRSRAEAWRELNLPAFGYHVMPRYRVRVCCLTTDFTCKQALIWTSCEWRQARQTLMSPVRLRSDSVTTILV